VTAKGKRPIENSWRWYLATINDYKLPADTDFSSLIKFKHAIASTDFSKMSVIVIMFLLYLTYILAY